MEFKSISIVGLEKNTGKTETLNYIIKHLEKKIGITSIGIDGESIDQVTATPKPEIEIKEGTIFATAERFYKQKRFTSEILSIEDNLRTSLGRIIIAKSLEKGKIILAGPQNTVKIKSLIERLKEFGAEIVLIDGALSRLSPASPVITDAMILSTGAALTININELVKKTKHIVNMILLEETEYKEKLKNLDDGIYTISDKIFKLPIKSLLSFKSLEKHILEYGEKIYLTGALTENFLKYLIKQKDLKNVEIIVKDFTKIFISPETYKIYIKKGGKITVLKKTKLIAITINPYSPNGYFLDSKELKNRLKKVINVPIINVREDELCLK
ncbi:hypothetical protein SAMN02745164_01828 [Marinitoga hydrogenitolerans DSM 16785]|uniref:Uncharacterized protein n=1 Tax=Marinitoga hydrogenitolerans (strain DSM 16785 / JCM 12826 / AT1271) TaxID=1122195 RepID=A0A1M4Z3R3_MARH1|nr:hypothetical protein [Marinitoga hydrogenitolerans]SHF12382.1 hypothetical protein SAMN02745164_01828 [Marinitoga hydrogenitolerans DSM 16785]